MGELFGGEENVGLRADGRRVGAAEMLPRSLRYVLAKGASTPVPSKLRASGMTVGGNIRKSKRDSSLRRLRSE
jgi:hypothetical protein